jgi:hypothetical protein
LVQRATIYNLAEQTETLQRIFSSSSNIKELLLDCEFDYVRKPKDWKGLLIGPVE